MPYALRLPIFHTRFELIPPPCTFGGPQAHFVSPKPISFQHYWVNINTSLFSIIPLLVCHFEYGHFTYA